MTLEPLQPDMPFIYRLAGLDILSEFPLPDVALRGERSPSPDRVLVRRAPVPISLPDGERFEEGQYDGRDCLIVIPEVARYLIRDGREIAVEQSPPTNDLEMCVFLLGTTFGALCHHRGILPLHACALETPKGCVAFAGASGEGKSTLAAALAKRGHNVLSDDVLYLRQDTKKHTLAWPGLGRIRLWDDSLDALGYRDETIQRETRDNEKFLVPIRPLDDPARPRVLRRVYRLEAAPEGEQTSFERVQGAAAIELLMPNVYRLTLAEHMGRKTAIFESCAQIARNISVYTFRRPLRFDRLAETIERLEKHLQDMD